jgi:hypothetical protein
LARTNVGKNRKHQATAYQNIHGKKHAQTYYLLVLVKLRITHTIIPSQSGERLTSLYRSDSDIGKLYFFGHYDCDPKDLVLSLFCQAMIFGQLNPSVNTKSKSNALCVLFYVLNHLVKYTANTSPFNGL